MRTSTATTWVAAAAFLLSGCAAQHSHQGASPAAITETTLSYKAHIVIEPGPMCPAYPVVLPVREGVCPVSHPYYRDARTLVVGPAPGTELDVTLKARCPALQGKATITVVQLPPNGKYFLGPRPLTRSCLLVVDPGNHELCVWVMGNRVKIANLKLSPDTDYFACVGDN